MAIQSNSSDVQVAGGGIPLFTGIAPVRVIAVNPTLGELASVGVNLKNEPTYDIDMGDKTGKLCFWIHNDQHNSAHASTFSSVTSTELNHLLVSSRSRTSMVKSHGQLTLTLHQTGSRRMAYVACTLARRFLLTSSRHGLTYLMMVSVHSILSMTS